MHQVLLAAGARARRSLPAATGHHPLMRPAAPLCRLAMPFLIRSTQMNMWQQRRKHGQRGEACGRESFCECGGAPRRRLSAAA